MVVGAPGIPQMSYTEGRCSWEPVCQYPTDYGLLKTGFCLSFALSFSLGQRRQSHPQTHAGSLRGVMSCSHCYYSLCYGMGTNKIDGIFSQIRKHFLSMAESLGSALTLGIRTPSSSSLELLSPEILSQAQWQRLPRQG